MKAIKIKLARAKEIARRGGPTFKQISGGKFRCNQAPEYGRLTMTNVEEVRSQVSALTAIKPAKRVAVEEHRTTEPKPCEDEPKPKVSKPQIAQIGAPTRGLTFLEDTLQEFERLKTAAPELRMYREGSPRKEPRTTGTSYLDDLRKILADLDEGEY